MAEWEAVGAGWVRNARATTVVCKETEAVLKRLEGAGWTIVYPSGHWGRA